MLSDFWIIHYFFVKLYSSGDEPARSADLLPDVVAAGNEIAISIVANEQRSSNVTGRINRREPSGAIQLSQRTLADKKIASQVYWLYISNIGLHGNNFLQDITRLSILTIYNSDQ